MVSNPRQPDYVALPGTTGRHTPRSATGPYGTRRRAACKFDHPRTNPPV